VGAQINGGPNPAGAFGPVGTGNASGINNALRGVALSGTSAGAARGAAITSAGGSSITSGATAAAGDSTGVIGTSEMRFPHRARNIIVPSVITRSPFGISTAFRVQKILSPRR